MRAVEKSQLSLGRDEVASWMHGLVASAESLHREELTRHVVAPAGICMELLFDDAAHAESYVARLAVSTVADKPRYRIYVLSSKKAEALTIPAWLDMPCSPRRFQELMMEAGLRANYPYRRAVWQFFSSATGIGVQISESRGALPEWDEGAPLRSHLHWILAVEGMRLTHAATLGGGKAGVLFAGHGGAGKSATTLAGLAAGLSTAGDDYVALRAEQRVSAQSLFRIIKQDRAGIARVPGLNQQTLTYPENWRGKVQFDPEQLFPNAFLKEIAIGAVMLPRIAHLDRPQIVPASAGDAMRALIGSNVYQFPGEPDDGMRYFGDLVRRIPCYRIDLSSAADRNGEALAEFIGGMG